MSEFEGYIKARYPVDYDSLKEKYPNVHICEFYGDEQNLWDLKQAKIDELEKQLIAQGQNFNDQSQNVRNLEFRNRELQKQLACCREENKALLAVNNSIDRECNHISPNTVVVK